MLQAADSIQQTWDGGEVGGGDVAFFTPPACGTHPHVQSLRVAFPGKSVALQARAHRNVVDGVAAAAALDGYSGGFGSHWGCRNYDPRDLHKVGHLVRLKGTKGKEGEKAITGGWM